MENTKKQPRETGIKNWFKSRIKKYLRKYLANFNLQGQLGIESKVGMRSIRFRVDALHEFHIPFSVMRQSNIESVVCKFPINFTSRAVKCVITNVKAIIIPEENKG